MAAIAAKTNDFFILGPIMARGNGVAEAIASLYYLPKRYKLVLHDSQDTDATFREEMHRLVKRMALTTRVRFSDIDMPEANAVIVGSATPTDMRDERLIISGGTPEALASAILNASRRLLTV
ncbi:MAG TPA: hypothetical protein VJP80_06055 [Candidatus Saccharimonadales bacterium]|nr:hypothetical protein [Candidatus Saccharimonadales bacterium]